MKKIGRTARSHSLGTEHTRAVSTMNTDKVLGFMMLTGVKGGSKGAGSGKRNAGAQGSGTAVGATQEQPVAAAQPMTGARVDGGTESSDTAAGAAQEQPAAAAQPMTGAHMDGGMQGSGDGAGLRKRKATAAQPGEGELPAKQKPQQRHELSQELPNNNPTPAPAPDAVQPAGQ